MPRMGNFVIDATWAALCSLTTMRIRRMNQTAGSHLCRSAGSFDRHIRAAARRDLSCKIKGAATESTSAATDAHSQTGPVIGAAEVLEALQEPPGSGDVDKSPLDDLAVAQSGPRAVHFTLSRRVGQSSAPMASECSGLPAGARGKRVHRGLKADTRAASRRGCPAAIP